MDSTKNGVYDGYGLMRKFQNLHGPLLWEFFTTEGQDRYALMCELHAYNKRKENSTGATDFHGCWPLQEYFQM